jgi:hypothetical protein
MLWKLLLISLLLAGCASNPPVPLPKPVVVPQYVYADCGTPPARSEVDFKPINWRIIVFSGENLFTLTTYGYKDLAFNTSEIIKGVKELKAEIEYYQACLDRQKDLAKEPDNE